MALPKNPDFDDVVEYVQEKAKVSEREAREIVRSSEWVKFDDDVLDEYLDKISRDFVRERDAKAAKKKESSDQARKVAKWLDVAGFYDGGFSDEDLESSKFDQAVADYQRARGINAGNALLDEDTLASIDEEIAFVRSQSGPARVQGPPAPAGTPRGAASPSPRPSPAGPSTATPRTSPAPTTETPTASTSGGSATTTTDLGGTPNPDGLFGIPGGAKIWKAPDGWYAVYTVPGSNPPVPLAWKIDDADLPAIFGPGNAPKADRTLSQQEWRQAGVLLNGSSRLLANTSEHPFDVFTRNFETEAKSRPWLRDAEILSLTVRAVLENRTVTDAELAQTKWWNTHTDGERKWLQTANSAGKAEVDTLVRDGREKVRQLMITAGVADPPDELVNLIGDRITAGTWSQQYGQSQITKLADPYASGDLDPNLSVWVSDLANKGITLNTLAENTMTVDKLISSWLGPAVGAGWTKDEKERWAGRLRNDPQAQEELVKTLQQQRLLMFPEYQDPNATYDAIAAPWRGQVQNAWGEVIDETDPFFTQVIRSNDLVAAQQMLRQEGRKRGIAKVVYDDLAVVGQAFGGTLRSAA